jgi:hypothetical protein
MTSFTWGADDVDSITVTGNTQLAAINFTGLADWGTSTAATVTISGNSLTATSFKDAYDATPATSDTGAFDAGTSGMKTLKPYLTAVLTSNTSVIGVYFDVVETLTEQLTSAATAYTDVAGHVDTVSGNTRNAYAYQTAFVADTTPTVRETHGYIYDVKRNSLFGGLAASTGEGIRITYGSVTKNYLATATANSVTDIINLINADSGGFGTGITLAAAQDSYAKSHQTLSYTDPAGAAETLANYGTIGWQLGTTTGVTAAAGNISTTANIATALASSINNTVDNGIKYKASASGSTITLSRLITNTANDDFGKNTAAFPAISIRVGSVTDTTVDFSANGSTTNSTGVNSDFFFGYTQTDVNGLRVSVINNSTIVALSAVVTQVNTVDVSGTSGIFLDGVAANSNLTALVSGTNMTGDASIDALFAEVSTTGSGTAAVVKNRTGW